MTDERSEAERDEEAIEHLKAQLTSANAEIWRLKRDRNDHHYATDHLAANAATIAAQAAEIERLKVELDGAVRHHCYTRNKVDRALGEPRFDDCDIWTAFERAIAALRSQLDEQRAKLECATEFYFGSVNIFCYTKPSDNHQWMAHWFNEDFTELLGESEPFGSLDECERWCIAANWLTPHAEKDGG